MKSEIIRIHNAYKNGSLTFEQALIDVRKKMISNKSLNSVITDTTLRNLEYINKLSTKNINDNLLYGITYSLKDNITVNTVNTTGGSQFLENYCPSFNATCYELLNKQEALLVSKDNMDEFGLGGTGTYSYYGIVKNPYDDSRASGGSSSGSVANVALGISTFAIATDTGDSIRRPASFCGVVGYKPTYGLISRYGVLPYAPSMDHVGVVSKYVADAVIVASTIIRFDQKDFASCSKDVNVKLNNLHSLQKINFVVIKNLIDLLEPQIKQQFLSTIKSLENQGHEIKYYDIDANVLKMSQIIYRALSYSEAFSCYSNMQGITFGKNIAKDGDSYETMLFKNRTNNFGNELKRRFVIGSYLTNAQNFEPVYLKAKKIRTALINVQSELLKKGDCILMPSASSIAPKIEEAISKGNMVDDLLVLSNFSGAPSITIPWIKIDGLPVGLNITCDLFEDMKVFNIAYTLENILGGSDE